MENITIFKPTVIDIPLMQSLVEADVENGNILHRNSNEMATTIRSYIAIKNGNNIIAFVALHIHTITLAEIRSLIVHKDYRGKGVGKKLVKACIDEARQLNLKKILVLTYQKVFLSHLILLKFKKSLFQRQKYGQIVLNVNIFQYVMRSHLH